MTRAPARCERNVALGNDYRNTPKVCLCARLEMTARRILPVAVEKEEENLRCKCSIGSGDAEEREKNR